MDVHSFSRQSRKENNTDVLGFHVLFYYMNECLNGDLVNWQHSPCDKMKVAYCPLGRWHVPVVKFALRLSNKNLQTVQHIVKTIMYNPYKRELCGRSHRQCCDKYASLLPYQSLSSARAPFCMLRWMQTRPLDRTCSRQTSARLPKSNSWSLS